MFRRHSFSRSLSLALSLTLIPAGVQADEQKVGMVVVIDDSGTLAEPEKAEIYKKHLLARIESLRKKRRYGKARIEVISTAFARSVWIGTPKDLKGKRANVLLPKVASHSDYCNNLPGAFNELEIALKHLKQQGYAEIWIFVFSSLIDTPRPCAPETTIVLPQLPPPLNYGRILTSYEAIQSIAFYWVNPYQKKLWLEALDPVRQWATEQGKNFVLFDPEGTVYALKSSLAGGL